MDKKVGIRSYLIDLVAFSIALALAYFLQWKTSDLVWSLWLGSLVIGYLTIISGVLGNGFMKGEAQRSFLPVLISSLFLIGFFTVHFGMFHFVHSVFLQSFFPLTGVSSTENPGSILPLIWEVLIPRYSLFLIPAIIVQRWDLLKPFMRAQGGGGKSQEGDVFSAPYRNVIKMHLLIFFFAGFSFLGLEGFIVYAVVYSVYFFPWRILFQKKT